MPRKVDVNRINRQKLNTCQGPTKVYLAQDMPGTTALGVPLGREEATKLLNQETRFPEKLDLRIGAQVMLVMVSLLISLCGP